MNTAKDSLKANMDQILANLPEEFHADFKKQMEEMSDKADAPLSGEDQVKAIKEELKANPNVDEKAAEAELKEIKPVEPATVKLSGEDEVKAIKAELKANPNVDEEAAAAELKEIKPANG